ncbi:MAG: hypothetical protein AB1938_12010 [Myxococcota bacterium]
MKQTLVVVVLALSACSTPTAQLRKELGPRASQYLSCDEKELQFKELDRLISSTKVRVTGCGKEAVYKLEESRWRLLQPGEN